MPTGNTKKHDCNIEVHLADPVAVASGYGTLAAILAGFAFSGLVLLFTLRHLRPTPLPEHNSYQLDVPALRMLLAAFVSLVIVAVNYSYLGGLYQYIGAAVSHSTLYGQAFAIGGMQLIFALLLIIRSVIGERFESQDKKHAGFKLAAIVMLGPFVTAAIASGTWDYLTAADRDRAWIVTALLPPIGLTLAIARYRQVSVGAGNGALAQCLYLSYIYKNSGRAITYVLTWGRRLSAASYGGTVVVALLSMATFLPTFNSSNPCHFASVLPMASLTILSGLTLTALLLHIASLD